MMEVAVPVTKRLIVFNMMFMMHMHVGCDVTCSSSEYEDLEGRCCSLCGPGSHVTQHCTEFRSTSCEVCPYGTFQPLHNGEIQCETCNTCHAGPGLTVKSPCTPTSNALCGPSKGFYCVDPRENGCFKAQKHSSCEPGQYIAQKGTSYTDTMCANCTFDTYSDGTFTTCQPHTHCEYKGFHEIKPGNHSHDTTCGGIHFNIYIFVGSVVVGVVVSEIVDRVGASVIVHGFFVLVGGVVSDLFHRFDQYVIYVYSPGVSVVSFHVFHHFFSSIVLFFVCYFAHHVVKVAVMAGCTAYSFGFMVEFLNGYRFGIPVRLGDSILLGVCVFLGTLVSGVLVGLDGNYGFRIAGCGGGCVGAVVFTLFYLQNENEDVFRNDLAAIVRVAAAVAVGVSYGVVYDFDDYDFLHIVYSLIYCISIARSDYLWVLGGWYGGTVVGEGLFGDSVRHVDGDDVLDILVIGEVGGIGVDIGLLILLAIRRLFKRQRDAMQERRLDIDNTNAAPLNSTARIINVRQQDAVDGVTSFKTDAEKEHFVVQNMATLVQDVTTVMAIVETLKKDIDIHNEIYEEIHVETKRMEQMRTVYCKVLNPGARRVKVLFYNALKQHQPGLLQKLEMRVGDNNTSDGELLVIKTE